MNSNLKGMVRAVVAIACLALPLAALGATKAELQQKAQAHKVLTGAKASPKATAKAADKQAAKEQKKALHAKKTSLMKERRTLLKQHDPIKRDANRQQLLAVNESLSKVKKGGAK
ncbi:MAG: hypothetical protein CVU66_01455 [Deltaproteobacteria bacterium HGW-Deltaproteobacteria-23]|nr:MAG: hypothetical protein CVU66_01455 [Deltaproteobacteria bacterium HGW-Deltaproteobacteria-23]